MFDQIRGPYDAGHAVTEIARKLGLRSRRVYRWVRRIDLPEGMRVSRLPCAPPRVRTLNPMTGRQISPLTAAALCVKPRGQMTARQIINVDALKAASADFTTMRALAMRFRGLLRGGTVERQDIEAVRNAVLEPRSNGKTEGQINGLKTWKRAMYGHAGVGLLRARMLPLQE